MYEPINHKEIIEINLRLMKQELKRLQKSHNAAIKKKKECTEARKTNDEIINQITELCKKENISSENKTKQFDLLERKRNKLRKLCQLNILSLIDKEYETMDAIKVMEKHIKDFITMHNRWNIIRKD